MTRRLALVALAVFAALAVLAWWVVADRAPGVTWSNARRVDRFMTLAEIEAILGPGQRNAMRDEGSGDWRPINHYVWEAPGLRVDVSFDDELVATHVGRTRPPPSFFDRCREWLGL